MRHYELAAERQPAGVVAAVVVQVWYGTLPDGPAFKIAQISMQEMYKAPSQLIDHPEYRNERSGVMVGYAGHVPRARDKVGGSPLGNIPGTPVSPNGAVGIDMEAMMSGRFERILPADRYKTFAQMPTTDSYTSEMRDEFGQSGNATLGQKDFLGKGGIKPKLYAGEDRGPATTDRRSASNCCTWSRKAAITP